MTEQGITDNGDTMEAVWDNLTAYLATKTLCYTIEPAISVMMKVISGDWLVTSHVWNAS